VFVQLKAYLFHFLAVFKLPNHGQAIVAVEGVVLRIHTAGRFEIGQSEPSLPIPSCFYRMAE